MARFALEPPLAGRPHVLDMVDVDSMKWKRLGAETSGPRGWVYRREAVTLRQFEARAVRSAHSTLVVSERERDDLLQIEAGAAIHVIPPGIELDAFAPPSKPVESAVVVFCGVMNYVPNEEGVRWFAEHIWPRIRAARADARFIIVGSDPTDAIRSLAARDSSIEVAGRVAEVQPYLWKSAVSVAPLRLSRGMQTKVLEAIAAGLPVVTVPAVFAGLPADVRAGCVTADQPADFADAVLRLLAATPDERRRHAAQARLDALQWRELARPLEGILKAAIDDGRRRADTSQGN
jgi:glycosyltransferase involved in cell wall biosynthesis